MTRRHYGLSHIRLEPTPPIRPLWRVLADALVPVGEFLVLMLGMAVMLVMAVMLAALSTRARKHQPISPPAVA